jgi:prepilin-type N-terminal cleavage/methylation domain-containing protein
MPRNHTKCARSANWRGTRGFSLIELVMATAVMLVLSAMAMPKITRAMHLYQLNFAASQVADVVKFTRFEAIRKNIGVNCRTIPQGTSYAVWTDNNNDGIPDSPERQFIMTSTPTFLPASAVASAGSLASSLGVTTLTTLSASGSTQTILFDQRGAVNFGPNPVTVYVYYIGISVDTSPEFRAVVVFPSGATQIWVGDPSTSTWRQMG